MRNRCRNRQMKPAFSERFPAERGEQRMAGKVTMADIAEMAGVTKSTVSRYFNGGYVKEETREKIRKAAKAHGYSPNTFARLKARESGMVGVVVPSLNSKISSRVITSIDRYLREEGYETLIKNSDHQIQLELDNIRRLMSLNVDGILISSISIVEEHRELIRNSPVPVVVLAQEYPEGISVVDDDYQAGFVMGQYVGRTNPKHTAYLSVTEEDQAVGVVRRRGVLDGLKSCGVENVRVLIGDYSYESGQNMTGQLLEEGPADAIICATDRLAFGAYRVLHDRGLSIPDDVSVAAFGGYDESSLLTPRLTTVKFDSYAVGYLGAETLLKCIRREPVPKKQVVGFQLIEGGSVRLL